MATMVMDYGLKCDSGPSLTTCRAYKMNAIQVTVCHLDSKSVGIACKNGLFDWTDV